MGFEKLKPIEGGTGSCGCCGYQHEHLPMDSLIAVGFGYAAVTKNGEEIYNEIEVTAEDWDDFWTGETAESAAVIEPENDWRIHLVAPLSERHYQRQGEKLWVLYEKGIGFA